MQNALEASNVNPVEELVFSMEMQRQFEINMKLISAAKDLDEGGAQLLRLPNE
jgi:flagellar basal-body rod protein FlgF